MACPYSTEGQVYAADERGELSLASLGPHFDKEEDDSSQKGVNKVTEKGLTYGNYLRMDKILDAQDMVTSIHDEHLFIITHQAYELWFKQIIFEMDSIRQLFYEVPLEEEKMLKVVSRMSRIVQIWKLLVDQIFILETMTPLDFLDFRGHLAPASGFQSLQFRIMENKLGIKKQQRVKYNQQHYTQVFHDEKSIKMLEESVNEPSLLDCLERWLERTPGLDEDGFNFWGKYHAATEAMIEDERRSIDAMTEGDEKEEAGKELERKSQGFKQLFNKEQHDLLLARGDRRISYQAWQGALMIYFYRDEPRFHEPFRFLSLLMDVDSLLTKWRYNHVMMVQRMIGGKVGTGGSSGFQYLRSTVSTRYQVFVDLFNLATYLIPRVYIPPLTTAMKETLKV